MSQEVRHWFEQAIEVPRSGRVAFLEAACIDDAIRAEVLSLLEHDAESLPQPPAAIRQLVESALADRSAPKRKVGQFELGRLLGSGGMGFVYEAHRVDGEVRQRVAVKFAQLSPASSEEFRRSVHRRFARERQVLASLRHPYIAGLIDAGTTDEGIPYAVIEQIDGLPIDTYSDKCLLDQTDRIQLVLKLCDAVQFAHRNLVVHSDIKPDNVLVTADGIPKLIDFGIASDLTEDATRTTIRAFTPGYASPEQCRGVAATVATDVYGLGAVLFRLLTGAKPRETTTDSIGEVMRGIWEEDVRRPSAIKPEIKGDLENILLKALQREPHRRYGSVPEFADDLKRFLARRPVRATPDSAWYRASRFMRRHWIPLAATAVLVMTLAALTARSVRERQQAFARAAETRRLAERLLFEVHDEIGGVLGGTRAREKLGQIAAQYLETLELDDLRDPELAWELLNAYARLGQSLGETTSSAGETRRGSHFATKTLALGALVESGAPARDRRDALFTLYEGLVPIFLEDGRTAEARHTIERMISLASELHPFRKAQAIKQLARYFDERGSQTEAAGTWAKALAAFREVSISAKKPARFEVHLASTLIGYGRAQALAGDFLGSLASVQEAVRISSQSTAAEPHIAQNVRQLYWSYVALGDVFASPWRFSLGRVPEAAENYRRAQEVAQTMVRADPANETARVDLARAFTREGVVLAQSDPSRGLALLERSHQLATATSPDNHAGLTSRFDYLTYSVDPLVRLGRFDEARARLAKARILFSDMRRLDVAVDEKSLLKADAIYLHASGRTREALEAALKQLALSPRDTRPVLSENHATVELLERIRFYTRGANPELCESASQRLDRIWLDLRAAYPRSTFVREWADRAQRQRRTACQMD